MNNGQKGCGGNLFDLTKIKYIRLIVLCDELLQEENVTRQILQLLLSRKS